MIKCSSELLKFKIFNIYHIMNLPSIEIDPLVIISSISGFILFIIGFIKFIHYLKDRKTKKNEKENERLGDIKIESISFNEVLEEYENATEIKKKGFVSSYQNVKVKWHFTFGSVQSMNKKKIGQIFGYLDSKSLMPDLIINVDFNKFPILQSAKTKDKFIVTGFIKDVVQGEIHIKAHEIERDPFFVF